MYSISAPSRWDFVFRKSPRGILTPSHFFFPRHHQHVINPYEQHIILLDTHIFYITTPPVNHYYQKPQSPEMSDKVCFLSIVIAPISTCLQHHQQPHASKTHNVLYTYHLNCILCYICLIFHETLSSLAPLIIFPPLHFFYKKQHQPSTKSLSFSPTDPRIQRATEPQHWIFKWPRLLGILCKHCDFSTSFHQIICLHRLPRPLPPCLDHH